jgi:hypothetical protein
VDQYIELDDAKEIRRLNNRLSARLRSGLPYGETRNIGYPQGNFDAKVRFLSASGADVFYWSAWQSKEDGTAGSFFGHGAPSSSTSLNIDVQFNFPVVQFSRSLGGAFLRDLATNSVVLAHRGIVTLGHGRVPKADLFAEMGATVREARTGNGSTGEFLLIGELESPTLINDIDLFASELRRTVRAIKAKIEITTDKTATTPSRTLSGRLRQYFDEFSGKRNLKSRRNAVADCYHGTVVRAIRDSFAGSAETLKSQAIDLTALLKKRVYLFEVKTSSSPQSIYRYRATYRPCIKRR